MNKKSTITSFFDAHPVKSNLRIDASEGLLATPKTLPSKYFYDEKGSKLFDRICELPEYYVTRTEIALLKKIYIIDVT